MTILDFSAGQAVSGATKVTTFTDLTKILQKTGAPGTELQVSGTQAHPMYNADVYYSKGKSL